MWLLIFLLFMCVWCLLICVCWTILVNLGYIPLGCGIWSFLCAVGIGWLNFVENFCIYIHKRYWPIIVWFWSLVLVLGWWWLHRRSLGVFSLQSFGKDPYKYFLCLVVFACEAIGSWTFVCRESFSFLFLFFFFFFLRPHLWHMKVSGLGVEAELQTLVHTAATAILDPSGIWDSHHSLW